MSCFLHVKGTLKAMVGEVHEAIVEGVSDKHPLLIRGRLWSQAPEIDGFTYLSCPRPLKQGEIVHVRVTQTMDYDLVAEVLDEDDIDIATSVPFNSRMEDKRRAAIETFQADQTGWTPAVEAGAEAVLSSLIA